MEARGSKFKIRLEGYMEHGTFSGTSDHYYDWEETRYWFEGQGEISKLKSRKKWKFIFTTGYCEPKGKLEDIFLKVKYKNWEKSRVAVMERLVDFQCARIIKELEERKSNMPIPSVGIHMVDVSEAEKAGIVPDANGQTKFEFCATIAAQ